MKTMGDKIKQLRRDKGVSQNEFAEVLGVTGQAVSKWEGNTSFPDISLMPEIAAYFGVTIDDLFEYSKEKQYEKIENMMNTKRSISNTEFGQYERFLLSEIEVDHDHYKAINLLSNLYEYYAWVLEQKAFTLEKHAIEIKPNSKCDLTIISHVNHGKLYDWNVGNHAELIEYWYELIRANDKNTRVYFYLLDDLMDAGRLKEAKQILGEAREKTQDTLCDAYEIQIREIEVGFAAVKEEYEGLAQRYKSDWRVLFNIANQFSHNEYYEQAIIYWQMAFDAMKPPRYTDFYDAMAQCYIRLGDNRHAVEMYKKLKILLKEEWKVSFGREFDQIDEKIAKLKP